MEKILKVQGMMCNGCVNRIKNVLENTTGVKIIDISLDEKKVLIDVDDELVLKCVIEDIGNLGFEVE